MSVRVLWVDKDVEDEVKTLGNLLGKNSTVQHEMDSFTAYLQHKSEELDLLVLDASQDEVFTAAEIGREDYYHFSERWKITNQNLYVIATSVMGGWFLHQEAKGEEMQYDERIKIGFPNCQNRKSLPNRIYEIIKKTGRWEL